MEILRLEKLALENRVKQSTARAVASNVLSPAAATSVADASRIKQLEHDRDDLQKRLEAANKEQ